MRKRILLLICILCTLVHSIAAQPEKSSNPEFLTKAFVHPGMAQSKQDLDYMREMVVKAYNPGKPLLRI